MSNRLASESSPYLLQHADNPVDWYPWGAEAFDLARRLDRPILLSIGYSACHWCHVMAHESFEDAATAALMNRLYVNVKVDREERPDVDRVYQLTHQLLTQRAGGWPLTMFLNPDDRRPFFGGTYFPGEARYGMPAFGELLASVARFFAERRDEIRDQGVRLSDVLRQLEPEGAAGGTRIDDAPVPALRRRLAETFDGEFGGFGGAPKFPHAATTDWLLRYWRSTAAGSEPDLDALFMATLTLTRMAEGGICDHLGGGFCRYSVDRYWQIPHFEKMLYDNGALLASYAQAFLATGEALFADTAAATARWLLDDMRSAEGGFYSARDADSEGEEGRYYVWTPDDARQAAGDDYDVFARRFGLDRDANFEDRWHLTVRASLDTIAADTGLAADDVSQRLERARARLLGVRAARVPPLRDEKQLTAWNALAIRGLALSGRALARADLVDAASGAAEFLHRQLFHDGRLFASYKDGRRRFAAYLDDHAFLVDALLELLQVRWNTRHLRFAIALADLLLEQFQADDGGFYFTAGDHEALIHRPRTFADDAMPSGNGIAAFALQRLGHLLGEPRYLAAAEKTLRAAWQAVCEYPHGHVSLVSALDEYLEPPEIIVIRGPDAERWRNSLERMYAPRRLIFAIDDGEDGLPGLLAERKPEAGATIAYRCVGTHCELPARSLEALAALL